MKPVKTNLTDKILFAPTDWNESMGDCKGLPVCHVDGVFYSYWKLTFFERMSVLFFGKIRLAMVGSAHPPVLISTTKEREL